MIDWTTFQKILETGSVILLLGAGLLAVVKGWVWPKAMVDKVIESQEKTATIIAMELKDGMEDAVKKGISAGLADGYMKITEINDKKK